ncbi:MAG: Gfo/Idh/MocA family oxidoreductase [Armatimonadetes bacterium]|nr:Gfo/Idh/MocA family oxidoreductase [Armatimonadota bacterium]
MTKYSCAIIGCGRIASTIDDDLMRKNISSHAGAYDKNLRTIITCAADINSENLKKFGKKWNVSHLYSSYEELFKKEKVDLVSICTPSNTHLNILKTAVESRVKGILCEKPISFTLNEADKMIKICYKNNVKLGLCHVRRWYLGVKKVKDLIDNGALGEIQSVLIVYCAGLANQGVHIFDTLNFLLNFSPIYVNFEYNNENFESGDMNLSGFILFQKDIPCQLNAVSRQFYTAEEIHLFGTKGKIILEHMSSQVNYYKVRSSFRFSNYSELFLEQSYELEEGPRMEAVLENMLNAMEGKEKLRCGGLDGRKALAITSALLESYYKKDKIYLDKQDLNIKILSA